MYSLSNLILISSSLLFVGLIFGYLIAVKRSPANSAQRRLEEHMEKLESQQQDYQLKVNAHFSETAQLLNQLTNSYKDVHEHLAKGAQLLCDEDHEIQLKRLTDDRHAARQGEDVDLDQITPPLDYAPKTGPEDKGMLNEEFGLEKTTQKDGEEANNGTPVIG